MIDLASYGVTNLTGRFVDRAIGAADLPTSMRSKLRRQQLRSVERMLPAMLFAVAVVGFIFLMLGVPNPHAIHIAALLVCSAIVGAFWLTFARRFAQSCREGEAEMHGLITVLCAAVLGVLCALLLYSAPLQDDTIVQGIAGVSVGGLLCVGMMALVHYPQALAAFNIPLIISAFGAVMGIGQLPGMLIYGSLLLGLTFVMIIITFNHASSFVAHWRSEAVVRQRGEIIGLLLREFEQTASDWIWGTDDKGLVNRISPGFTSVTGVPEEDFLGVDLKYFLTCLTPPDDPLVAGLFEQVRHRRTFKEVELRVDADNGESWWSLTGKPVFDEDDIYLGYIGTCSDITERRTAERRITMLAHHDSMTGLFNRTKFTEQLNSCVARLERYGTPFCVMFLDLDQFKTVNDSFGHMIGDKLLVKVAKRILAVVRDTDAAARLGGDEFAIILPVDCDKEQIDELAERLIDEVRRPYMIDGDQATIGVSIGIAMAPVSGTRPDQILRNADLALYRAKADGRSVYRYFENQMDSEARERRLLEAELREAVPNNELVLHYQPLIAVEDGSTTGFEALVRWNHPIRGLVPPAEFISIAEQSQLIMDIGDWTIGNACLTAATWPEHLTVAVNLSAKHFRRSDIAQIIQNALTVSGLAPQRLEIEITEGLLMESLDEVVAKLIQIRALGVTVAMDDFGTGYSSLSYLLKFPFDKIKIDRSFVDASSDDEVAKDILRAIASLGKSLKVKITAEGVETKEQADFLSQIACNQLQGFYFSRPLDQVDMAAYLLTRLGARLQVTDPSVAQQLALAS